MASGMRERRRRRSGRDGRVDVDVGILVERSRVGRRQGHSLLDPRRRRPGSSCRKRGRRRIGAGGCGGRGRGGVRRCRAHARAGSRGAAALPGRRRVLRPEQQRDVQDEGREPRGWGLAPSGGNANPSR